jgi:hypothetical protein
LDGGDGFFLIHLFGSILFVLFFFILRVFVIFLILFVLFVDEGRFGWVGVVDEAGLGEVEAWGGRVFGGGLEGADTDGGVRLGEDAGGVGGGELQAVEEGRGAFGLELAGGQRIDDLGDGDLDGLAVLERAEFDVFAGNDVEIETADLGLAVGGVALVETGVEVAERRSGECGAAALDAIGSDGAAESDVHGFLLEVPPTPPGGVGLKLNGCKHLATTGAAKYLHPDGLRVNI